METGKTIPIVCVCEKRARLERTSDGRTLRCSDSDCIHSNKGHHFESIGFIKLRLILKRQS